MAHRDSSTASRRDAGLVDVEWDDIGPERIFHYYDPSLRFRAILVIDSTRFGLSAGGVRMAEDLSVREMVRLARAMSYKFAMLELPCGGAKAGVWWNPSDPARHEVMRAFLTAIRPLLDARAYLPGADMGTSASDFSDLMAEGRNLGAEEFEGMLLEDQLTGYGVVVAAQTACKRLGMPIAAARVALEGFGKVGAGAAKFFARAGAVLVAVSTVDGVLHRTEGIDVERLLALRANHGDAALQQYAEGEALLPRKGLLCVPSDILVPGARPDVINGDTAGTVAARLIVPAANIPYAAGTPAQLHERGIVPLPDFVTNAGGVLAGLVGLRGGSASDAFFLVEERVARTVESVLDAAAALGCSAYDAGLAQAREKLLGEAPPPPL